MRRNYFGTVENTFALQSLAGGIRARRAHPDQARRQLLEEPQHVSPTQLPANDRTAVRFSAMDLKYLLGQIQIDGGKPDIFNTDQGSQFTSFAFTNTLKDAGIRISMDGRGLWMDNVFIERLWRSIKYECVFLNAFETGSEARTGIGRWID
jgi:putative transposase